MAATSKKARLDQKSTRDLMLEFNETRSAKTLLYWGERVVGTRIGLSLGVSKNFGLLKAKSLIFSIIILKLTNYFLANQDSRISA